MTKSYKGKIATKTGKEHMQPKTANSSAAAVSCGHDQQQPANSAVPKVQARTYRVPPKQDTKGKHPLSITKPADKGTHVSATSASASSNTAVPKGTGPDLPGFSKQKTKGKHTLSIKRPADKGTHVSATSASASSNAGSRPAKVAVSTAPKAHAVGHTAKGKTKLLKKGSHQQKRATLTTANVAAGFSALAGANDALKEKLAEKANDSDESASQTETERKPLFNPIQIFGRETVPQGYYIPPDYKVVKTVKVEAPEELRQIYDSYPDHSLGFNAVVKYLRQQTALSKGDAPEELFYQIADSIVPQDQRDLVHRATKLSKAPVALVTVQADPWSVSYWLNALKIADWKGDNRYFQLLGYACGILGGMSLTVLTIVVRRFASRILPVLGLLPDPVRRVIQKIIGFAGATTIGVGMGVTLGSSVALAYTAHCFTRPHGIRPIAYTFSPIIANGISARVASDASLRSVVQDGGVQATRIYSCINIPADLLAEVRTGSVQNAVEKCVQDTPSFLNFIWGVARPLMTKIPSDLASVLSFRKTCFVSKHQEHTFTQVYPTEQVLSTYPMSKLSTRGSQVSNSSDPGSHPDSAGSVVAPTVIIELPVPASPMTAQALPQPTSSVGPTLSGPPEPQSVVTSETESSDSDSDSEYEDADGGWPLVQNDLTSCAPQCSNAATSSSGPPPVSP